MPKRVDSNQRKIVAALRAVGAMVMDLHSVGRGCPDLLCSYRGKHYLIEVKSPHGYLTPAEEEFRLMWAAPVYTVRSVDEALAVIGAIDD